MPQVSSDQYEQVEDSLFDEGTTEDNGGEIATRTVNKQRRTEARTSNNRAQGAGNPNRGLDEHTRDELYDIARQRSIKGRSTMRKDELVSALRKAS